MLVQVKHRGWVFIQGFYYKKGRGRGSTYRGRTGEVRKKEGRKVKSIHDNCFYGREIQPEVKELQCPLQNTEKIQLKL